MKETKQWSEEKLLNFKTKWKAIIIPVNIEIENRQVALNLTKTNQILMQADKIALRDCICRVTLQNCDFPHNTCILLNKRAEDFVNKGSARWITQEQAINIMSDTHKKGLVHLAMHQSNIPDQLPSEICSCCPCCCQALQGLQLLNMRELVKPSELIASFDLETCNQCGICVNRCQFGARIFDSENNILFRQELCFGCGLCVSTCPVNAIELITR